MVFSSVSFLFFFLPPVLALALVCKGRLANVLLLLASLLFYAWGEGGYVLVMLAAIGLNFVLGRFLEDAAGRVRKKILLAGGIGINLLLLAYFKYANFFIDNLNTLLTPLGLANLSTGTVHLPIGISFFTFQAISYLLDVAFGTVRAQRSLLNLGLYISFFPQLIAGPIIRYHDIVGELANRKITSADCAEGIRRFIVGLGKKMLLANPLALAADTIFTTPPGDLAPATAWLGAICYTFQIYCDFSGYSDMAIGLGRLFGFHFRENFNTPYSSLSIREFWRRWHISLSNWFRDYVYVPLGGNRLGSLRTAVNLWIVFLLCGFWHGASWTFVTWGLYHGCLLALERIAPQHHLERIWAPLRWAVTMALVIAGWVLFRCDTLADGAARLVLMAGHDPVPGSRLPLAFYVDGKLALELLLAFAFSFPLAALFAKTAWSRAVPSSPILSGMALMTGQMVRLAFLAVILYFSLLYLAAGVYNPFIYFRF